MANKTALVIDANGDLQQIQAGDSLAIPELIIGTPSNQSSVTPFTKAGGAGIWYDLPTTGPSGIGTGGQGVDAWLGYCFAPGQWCGDSLAGDLAYRSLSGRLLWGTSTGPSQMALSPAGLAITTPITIPTALPTDIAISAVNIAFLKKFNLQKFYGNVGQVTGTSKIPFDNTQPLITDGSQIWSQAITPTDNTTSFQIKFSGMLDSSSNNNNITLAVFRDNTYIGSVSVNVTYAGRPHSFSLTINDSPASAAAVTYSCRIGCSSNATWYFGRPSGVTMGGVNNSGWTINEVY